VNISDSKSQRSWTHIQLAAHIGLWTQVLGVLSSDPARSEGIEAASAGGQPSSATFGSITKSARLVWAQPEEGPHYFCNRRRYQDKLGCLTAMSLRSDRITPVVKVTLQGIEAARTLRGSITRTTLCRPKPFFAKERLKSQRGPQ